MCGFTDVPGDTEAGIACLISHFSDLFEPFRVGINFRGFWTSHIDTDDTMSAIEIALTTERDGGFKDFPIFLECEFFTHGKNHAGVCVVVHGGTLKALDGGHDNGAEGIPRGR